MQKQHNYFFSVLGFFLRCLAIGCMLTTPTQGFVYNTLQMTLQETDSSTVATKAHDLPIAKAIPPAPDSLGTADRTALVDTTAADTVALPVLERPMPLTPLPIERVYPYQTIDQLIKKQVVTSDPYIPVLQEIMVGIEVISLGKNTWQVAKNIRKYDPKRSYSYETTWGALFRKNIRLVVDIGYAHLYPDALQENRYRYQAAGLYARGGLDYVIPYKATEYFYIGARYGGARFINQTLNPSRYKQSLSASWVEGILGLESGLLERFPLYGGCTIRSAWLATFSPYEPAKNYYIPGYGLNANPFSLGIDLYLIYKFSFLERMIQLS